MSYMWINWLQGFNSLMWWGTHLQTTDFSSVMATAVSKALTDNKQSSPVACNTWDYLPFREVNWEIVSGQDPDDNLYNCDYKYSDYVTLDSVWSDIVKKFDINNDYLQIDLENLREVRNWEKWVEFLFKWWKWSTVVENVWMEDLNINNTNVYYNLYQYIRPETIGDDTVIYMKDGMNVIEADWVWFDQVFDFKPWFDQIDFRWKTVYAVSQNDTNVTIFMKDWASLTINKESNFNQSEWNFWELLVGADLLFDQTPYVLDPKKYDDYRQCDPTKTDILNTYTFENTTTVAWDFWPEDRVVINPYQELVWVESDNRWTVLYMKDKETWEKWSITLAWVKWITPDTIVQLQWYNDFVTDMSNSSTTWSATWEWAVGHVFNFDPRNDIVVLSENQHVIWVTQTSNGATATLLDMNWLELSTMDINNNPQNSKQITRDNFFETDDKTVVAEFTDGNADEIYLQPWKNYLVTDFNPWEWDSLYIPKSYDITNVDSNSVTETLTLTDVYWVWLDSIKVTIGYSLSLLLAPTPADNMMLWSL